MRFLVLFFLVTPLAAGFLTPEPMPVKPGLRELVDAQPDQRLSLNLNIGKEGDASRLSITGMVLDLNRGSADEYEHVSMPGMNGPHPKLSSGIRRLNLIKEGSFISMKGTEVVKTLKGGWEMVWREDVPAGVLLCGFEIPEDYKRNDAMLPKGRIYMSFPVWTKETLAYAQSEKERVLKLAEECIDEKNQELAKSEATNNPLMKALYYRNAYAATEKYLKQPVKSLKEVPEADEVMALQDNLLLTTKGLVWTSPSLRGEQVLLGTVNLSPVLAEA